MNKYSISATEAFLNAAKAQNVFSMASYLSSRAFGAQAESFFQKRWTANAASILEDLSVGTVYRHNNCTEISPQGKNWCVFYSFIDARKTGMIPLSVLKHVPIEIWQMYKTKLAKDSMDAGQETLLSCALRDRKLPAEHKAYLSALPNQPNLPSPKPGFTP